MKSFAVIDLLAHVATSRESWHGIDVGTWLDDGTGDLLPVYEPDQHPVAFVPGEGRDSADARFTAWEEHHGQPIPSDRLLVASWMPDFTTGDGFDKLLAAAEEQRFSLIVVDTMRKAAGAGDENSASERGALIDRCYRLSEASGGTVLMVAHSGLAEGRIRGSSAQFADVDFVLQVKREDGSVTISTDKMKDGSGDRELVLEHRPAGESLVLVSQPTPYPGSTPIWTSTRLQDALYGFVAGQIDADQGAPNLSTLKKMGKDDHGASPTSVQRAVTDLCARDLLRVIHDGKVNYYSPGPVAWPSQNRGEGQ